MFGNAAATSNVVLAGFVLQAIVAAAILAIDASVTARMSSDLPLLLLGALMGAALYAVLFGGFRSLHTLRTPQRFESLP